MSIDAGHGVMRRGVLACGGGWKDRRELMRRMDISIGCPVLAVDDLPDDSRDVKVRGRRSRLARLVLLRDRTVHGSPNASSHGDGLSPVPHPGLNGGSGAYEHDLRS